MEFWRSYHERKLFDENAVAGVHLIELLESWSRFPSQMNNYFSRVNASISFLPDEWKDAAALIFSRTVYLPQDFLDDALVYLWNAAIRRIGVLNTPSAIGKQCHFFEVDPSGMLENFVHQNRIHQRLHPDYYARIFDVNALASAINLFFHGDKPIQQMAAQDLLMLGRKSFWLILSDKVLSGQSLVADLQRYALFRRMITEAIGERPRIIVLAQVITEDALNSIKNGVDSQLFDINDCIYAFKLGADLKVGSKTCTLYRTDEQRQRIIEFCKWFFDTFIVPDSRFETMIQKSNGDMSLGYRQSGLYFVDSSNAPTNSLPPIWYDNLSLSDADRKGMRPYRGPYPRVHSRMGAQQVKSSAAEAWTMLQDNHYSAIVERLRENDRGAGS